MNRKHHPFPTIASILLAIMLLVASMPLSISTASESSVAYAYDDIYRLTEEFIDDPAAGTKTLSYTYDAVGNRLTKTDDGVVTNYTYDANDRLLTEGGNTYSYDENGNMVSESDDTGSSSYAYDYQNRLAQVSASDGSVIEYAYDSDSIRVQKTVDGTNVTNYLVDTNRPYAQVLEERDESNALQVSYVYGDDLISQNRGSVDSYYHYDGQLSTRALSDSSETVTDTYTYNAFGNLLAQTGATENNYLYTGEQYDANAGFYYLRARYYDTGIGRFTTTDPWQGSVSDPSSLHKYLYAGADPVNNWDPSGKFTLSEVMTGVGMRSVFRWSVALNFINIVGSAWDVYELAHEPSLANAAWCALGIMDVTGASDALRITGRASNLFSKAIRGVDRAVDGLKYVDSGVLKYTYRGRTLQIEAVSDLSHMKNDNLFRTALDGISGKTPDGDTIVLHHYKQNPEGPIIEMAQKTHRRYSGDLHQRGLRIDPEERRYFNNFKRNYWQSRGKDEIYKRLASGNLTWDDIPSNLRRRL